MKNTHDLIGYFFKGASKTMRAEYESKNKLPDLDTFKTKFIQEARILANNYRPNGQEKEGLMTAFELTAKRIREGTEPKLEALIVKEHVLLQKKTS